MKKAPLYVLLLSVGLITAAAAKWSRLPGVDKKLVNMSTTLAGSSVSQSQGIPDASGLVQGDPIRAIKIAAGKSDAVIKFAEQAVVETVSFVSDGLEGKVAASVSTDAKAWSQLASAVFSPADRVVKIDAGAAQGRYLRLQFELVRGGSIRNFQVLGSDNDSNYTVKESEDGSGSKVNFAGGIGGGRLIYISPESYSSASDAVSTGSIEFPESDEKYRTAVYDLGQVRSLEEFGSVHSPRPVRLAVYTFEVLPEKEDWRGRLAFDPTVFDTLEPVASGEDASGQGFVTIKTKSKVKSRYIALRWEPDFNPPSFDVSGVNLGGGGYNVSRSGGGGAGAGGGQGGGQGGDNNNPGGPFTPFVNPFGNSGGFSTSGFGGNTGVSP